MQTRALRGGNAGGCGFYSVADGVLTMRDESGKPTGKEYLLGRGDNAQQIAGRLAREAWFKAMGTMTDFDRPLHYSKAWMA